MANIKNNYAIFNTDFLDTNHVLFFKKFKEFCLSIGVEKGNVEIGGKELIDNNDYYYKPPNKNFFPHLITPKTFINELQYEEQKKYYGNHKYKKYYDIFTFSESVIFKGEENDWQIQYIRDYEWIIFSLEESLVKSFTDIYNCDNCNKYRYFTFQDAISDFSLGHAPPKIITELKKNYSENFLGYKILK